MQGDEKTKFGSSEGERRVDVTQSKNRGTGFQINTTPLDEYWHDNKWVSGAEYNKAIDNLGNNLGKEGYSSEQDGFSGNFDRSEAFQTKWLDRWGTREMLPNSPNFLFHTYKPGDAPEYEWTLLLTPGKFRVGTAKSVTTSAEIEIVQGYKSFSAFKKAFGPAGEEMAWHHIVEQGGNNVTKFGAEAIHNAKNIIKLPNGAGSIHAKVTGYYNSLIPGTRIRVRDYVRTLNFDQQYQYGIDVLKRFGWKP